MTPKKYDYEQVKYLYQSGKSIREIKSILGPVNVRYVLDTLGVERRPRGARPGALNHQYTGGVWQRHDGYKITLGDGSKLLQHRVIAAAALGRELHAGMVVHHIDCNPANNAKTNLLICSQAYHMALHARMKKHQYWSKFSNPQKKYK